MNSGHALPVLGCPRELAWSLRQASHLTFHSSTWAYFSNFAYAPTEDATDVAKDIFYDQLDKTLRLVPAHDQLVILGDLNDTTEVDRTVFETLVGPFGSGNANDNSLRLPFVLWSVNLGLVVQTSQDSQVDMDIKRQADRQGN